MGENEHFEMLANEFYLDTGYLAPGKSESPVTYYECRDSERHAAWRVWNKMRENMVALRSRIEDTARISSIIDWGRRGFLDDRDIAVELQRFLRGVK